MKPSTIGQGRRYGKQSDRRRRDNTQEIVSGFHRFAPAINDVIHGTLGHNGTQPCRFITILKFWPQNLKPDLQGP
jgi:hypothetical protein